MPNTYCFQDFGKVFIKHQNSSFQIENDKTVLDKHDFLNPIFSELNGSSFNGGCRFFQKVINMQATIDPRDNKTGWVNWMNVIRNEVVEFKSLIYPKLFLSDLN